MSRRSGLIVVATLLTSLLFASVSTSGGVNLWGDAQWDPAPLEIDPIEIDISIEESDPPPLPDEDEPSPIEIPSWLEAILRVVLAATVIATIIGLVVAGWQRRPRLRWQRRAAGDGHFDALPDIAAAVVDEAVAQRTALLRGAPRNAIVRCWLRLERDVAAAGLLRRPADTSVEFTERVLARYTVDPEAIRELAALYREARFSEHPLDESSRQAALAALDRLHQALIDFAADTSDVAESSESAGSAR